LQQRGIIYRWRRAAWAHAGAGEGGAGGVDGAGREADQQLVHQPAEAALEAGAAGDGAGHGLQAAPVRRRRLEQLGFRRSPHGGAALRRRELVSAWPLMSSALLRAA